MLNPATIRTVSDLRANPLSVLKAAKEGDEPIYIFYRAKPQAAVVSIEDFNNLVEEIEDLRDALEVAKRQKDPKRVFVSWEKIKKELNVK